MNVAYQAIVGVQSTTYFNFLSGNGAAKETPVVTKPWLNVHEEWKILKYGDVSSTATVKFGDIVSFENKTFSTYLSGFPGYIQLTTMDAMQDFERWKLIDPADTSSTADVTTDTPFLLQLVNNNGSHYAKVDGGDTQSSVPLASVGSEFRIVQTSVP